MQILKLLTFTVFIFCGAAQIWAAPQETVEDTQSLNNQRIKSLLEADKHLPDIRRVAFYENWKEIPQDIKESTHIFQAQKIAITEVKSKKIVSMVPSLIAYLDYPIEGGVPLSPPDVDSILSEAIDSWPAFNAIYSFGSQAVSPLVTAINDQSLDLRLRLTALQVLWFIDKTQAHQVGKSLTQNFLDNRQLFNVQAVEKILAGRNQFWGLINYQPITFSVEQVRQLLKSEKHLAKPRIAMVKMGLLPPDASQSEKDSAKAEFDNYSLQKEAIRSAGELKLVELIPNLLLYMDYPADGGSSLYSAASRSVLSRRRNWPALDAILKMEKNAVAPLENVINDKGQAFEMRRNALSVLKDLAPETALTLGHSLLDELENTGDQKSKESVQYILERQ